MRPWLSLLLMSAACGGGFAAAPGPLPARPAPETRATLVGPRCASADACVCRSEGAGEPEDHPVPPFKRFEVQIGPIEHALWVTVDDAVLYKSSERATECFYLDLLPGEHAVTVRGARDNGVPARVQISELSAAGPWWYATFELDCNGVCTPSGLRAEAARIAAYPRHLHDPCGSTKVRGFRWQTGTMPDGLHPSEVAAELVLDVYEFATKHAPGSPRCSR
jgi:hypothetical protein